MKEIGRNLRGCAYVVGVIAWALYCNARDEWQKSRSIIVLRIAALAAHLWRFLVALVDWRTWLRILRGQPVVDVVFISNMRDDKDRGRFLGSWEPPEGHFNGPRYWFGEVAARTRALCVTQKDLETSEGRERARGYFFAAAKWAEKNGASVILLAASTKRLMKRGELQRRFPKILFTIGDNGTSYLLCVETLRALQSAGLTPSKTRVCVTGPTGFLGRSVSRFLVGSGYDVIGLCRSTESANGCDIEAHTSFEEIGKVDAIVACANGRNSLIKAEIVEMVKRDGQRLIVIDPSEPSGFPRKEYLACGDSVIRQDAGNAYSPKLKYVLGAISYKLFRLTQGVTFGCFAEAMMIGAELKAGEVWVYQRDWFTVSEENIETAESLFAHHSFGVPSPRCFGKPVTSFDLRS